MDKKAKISRLILEDIRGFRNLDIDFTSQNTAKNWSLFLGNNGTGKSTILRTIAIALGDRSHAAGLLLEGSLVRQSSKSKKGRIKLEFERFSKRGRTPSIDIEIKRQGDREIISKYVTSPINFDWNKIFVCGYGAGRGVDGTESWSKYRVSDSVYNLFQYSHPLQNGELALLRMPEKRRSGLLKVIDDIMMLEPGSSKLTKGGIMISGPWGDLPLKALGDGYKAIFAWVADLMGWAIFLEHDVPSSDNINGIVLIDEIDQHLHPVWQRRIVKRLYKHFPNIQFIATTHSPIVALGTTDLSDDVCEVFSVYFDDEESAIAVSSGTPRGQGIDQILTSHLFRLQFTSDDETAAKIRQLSELGQKRKTKTNIEKRNRLISEIRRKVGTAPSEMEDVVKRTLSKVLEETMMSSYKKDRVSLELEIRRQVDNLLKNGDR